MKAENQIDQHQHWLRIDSIESAEACQDWLDDLAKLAVGHGKANYLNVEYPEAAGFIESIGSAIGGEPHPKKRPVTVSEMRALCRCLFTALYWE